MTRKYKSIQTVLAIFIMAFFFVATPVSAQKNRDQRSKQLLEYKHQFYKKALALTPAQEAAFFKAFDLMDEELYRIGSETRALERKYMSAKNATDTELESAARTLFEQKKKEAEVELKYFEQFKNILTKRQLLMLKETERRCNKGLLRQAPKPPKH